METKPVQQAAKKDKPSTIFNKKFELKGHKRAIATVKYSSDGKFLASAGADKSILVWDPFEGKQRATLEGHAQGVSDVSWSYDSRFLASGSDDNTVRVWDVEKSQCIRTLTGHDYYVFTVAYGSNSNLIASGGFDKHVRLWDTRSWKCVRNIQAHSDPVTSVSFNNDETKLVSGSYDGLCRIWSVNQSEPEKTLTDDSQTCVSFVRYSPNGRYILVGTLNNLLRLWDPVQNKCMKTYSGHTNHSYCMFGCFSVVKSYGKYVVSGSEDESVYVYDLQKKGVVQQLKGHSDVVLAVDANSHYPMLASGGLEKDRKVIVWEQ